ncbi:hypothetical protein G9A89_009049 [Geosiphon pyriformis]|nr:hypothetical protein G9A89_009049 [Geosiphon pyriformis]
MCGHFKTINTPAPLIKFEEEEEKPTWEAYQVLKQREEHTWRTTINAWTDNNQSELLPTISWEEKRKGKEKEKNKTQPKDGQVHTPFASCYHSHHLFHLNAKTTTGCEHIIIANHAITNATDIQSAKASGTMNHVLLVVNSYSTRRYGMTFLIKEEHATLHTIQGATPNKILEIKNNPPEQIDIIFKRAGAVASICNLIYNPPIRMIYIIPEKEKPISSCTSELESIFNPDLNSNNDNDKNTSSSSIQYSNEDNSNLDSDPNSKTFIALFDLTKEQELKWFSDNNEGIMPEYAHDTNTGFDLRYPRKNAIKLEPYLHTCIDLKIALEILATTMV